MQPQIVDYSSTDRGISHALKDVTFISNPKFESIIISVFLDAIKVWTKIYYNYIEVVWVVQGNQSSIKISKKIFVHILIKKLV